MHKLGCWQVWAVLTILELSHDIHIEKLVIYHVNISPHASSKVLARTLKW